MVTSRRVLRKGFVVAVVVVEGLGGRRVVEAGSQQH